MKLFITTPTNRAWSPHYGMSILGLTSWLNRNSIPYAYECRVGSSLLPASRHESLQFAIKKEFTHALMIDDDMAFKPDAFLHLMNRALGGAAKFIAANCVTKPAGSHPGQPCSRNMDGDLIYSAGNTGIQQTLTTGLGFMLVNLEALRLVGLPWFETPWDSEIGATMGEDHFFCLKVQKAGFKIYVDHDASQHVGHVGDAVYTEANLPVV